MSAHRIRRDAERVRHIREAAAKLAEIVVDGREAFDFFFLAEPDPTTDPDGLRELATQGEEFVLTEGVLYLHTPDGFGRSKLVERLQRFIGTEMTARNHRTVGAIRALV